MSREPQIMTIFVSTLYDKNWPSYGNFKIWPIYWPGDVIDDVMSMYHITCTIRHPHLYSCKILFVWYKSFIVKTSRQTSWQTNKHTGWKHYHLAIAGDNHQYSSCCSSCCFSKWHAAQQEIKLFMLTIQTYFSITIIHQYMWANHILFTTSGALCNVGYPFETNLNSLRPRDAYMRR